MMHDRCSKITRIFRTFNKNFGFEITEPNLFTKFKKIKVTIKVILLRNELA